MFYLEKFLLDESNTSAPTKTRREKMSLDERFQAAAADVKSFTKRPSNDELLVLYGLFKQANDGDNTTCKY